MTIKEQAKTTKGSWYSARLGGGHFKLTDCKNISDDGKDLNMLVSLAVAKAMKMNKKSKAKENSDLENESENFKFEHFNIGVEYN